MVVTMDPPDHTRLRRLVSAGFTPRMIAQARQPGPRRGPRTIVDRALERGDVQLRARGGLPAADAHDRRHRRHPRGRPRVAVRPRERASCSPPTRRLRLSRAEQRRRSRPRCSATRTQLGGGEAPPPGRRRVDHAHHRRDRAARRRPHPPHASSSSTSSSSCSRSPGSETTRNAISAGLIALLEHPDQLDLLRSDPT